MQIDGRLINNCAGRLVEAREDTGLPLGESNIGACTYLEITAEATVGWL